MNDEKSSFIKKQNISAVIMLAVVATIIVLFSHRFIPQQRYQIAPAKNVQYELYSTQLADGPSGVWIDKDKLHFSCRYPEGFEDSNYYCSFNRRMGSETRGVDLSKFSSINIHLEYTGNTPKLRLFARNFNTEYSTPFDSNSSKYNAIFLPQTDLKDEITLSIHDFAVTEWWLLAYHIPRKLSAADLRNIVTIGIDFSYPMTHGNHEVTIKKIEFVGDWVSREIWYLSILCTWLAGIFIYQLNQLRLSRARHTRDSQIIDNLHQDNESLKQETRKFRRLSTVDPLTQAYNRFGIDQIVTSLLNSHEPPQSPGTFLAFSLILIDIDHFKHINDSYGHDAGDQVLQSVSSWIQLQIGSGDYLGRWGGEEFLIILPHLDSRAAMELAESIRQQLENNPVHYLQGKIRITASFGVGSCLDGDFPSAFKRVDNALYDAKKTGRNRCMLAGNQ